MPAPAHPAAPQDPAKAGDVAALRAECQRLRELSARQAQEFAALNASLEKKLITSVGFQKFSFTTL